MNWLKYLKYAFVVASLLCLLPLLAVAAPTTAPQANIEQSLLDQFTADGTADFVVVFAEQADLSPAYSMDWDARGEFVYNTLKETAARTQAQAKAYLDSAGLTYQTFIAGNELYVWAGNLTAATALTELPEVALVRATRTAYIDPIVEVEITPDTPNALDWGIIDTKADQFWAAFGFQGEGIVVSNIDTGVQWDHPALDQAYKCPADPTNTMCWYDPSNTCGGTVCDNVGHGTHTMGTMVGDDDPALTWQAGMAPNAQFIMCKGCESTSCSEASLNACADWILAPGGNSANRPDIVNNSWGGGGCDTWYQAKVQAWRASGIFPAFSSGNSTGCGSMGSPGDYQESFASTGHDSSRNHAWSQGPSCFGDDPYTKPNITAPSINVCSSVPTNAWSCGYSGTSMASPHSAGAVALLWSCDPALIGDMDATFEALQNTADPPDPVNPACGAPSDGEGTYEDGYGYLNVYQAGLMYCGDIGHLAGHVYEATKGPIEGATVSANGATATTDADGYYTMTLAVGTYDVTAEHPLYTAVTIPDVVVTTDTATIQDFSLEAKGRLFGYVTDYDNNVGLEATVTADDGTTADTNPATGYYEMYLDEGTYVVTATAQDYADGYATVDIASGADTQQDFVLKAAVVFIPSPLHVTLDWQTTGSVDTTMLNRMITPYDFEFAEKPGGFQPAMAAQGWGEGTITWLERNTEGVPVATSDSGTTVAYPGAYRYTPAIPSQFNVLVYTDDWIHVTPNTLVQQALARLGLAATVYIDGDYTGFQTALNTGGPWDLVIWSGENYQPDPSLLVDLLTYVQGGGKLAATYWRQLDYPTDPLWTEMGFTYIDNYIAPLPAYWWDPGHPIFNNPESAPEWIDRVQNSSTSQGTYLDPLASGVALAGYTTTPAPNEAGMVLRDDGMTIYKGLRDVSTDADADFDGVLDGVELWENIMTGLLNGFGGDVPWFGQDPITGTVPASGTLEAEGIFTPTMLFTATYAAGVNQPGDYFCDLKVKGDPDLTVHITMTVLPPGDMGKVEGYVLDNCTGEPVEATVDIAGGDPITQTMSDPNTGYYAAWLFAGSYDLTFSADGYLNHTDNVDIVGGETTALDVSLVPDRPCMAVEPDLLEFWVISGTQESDLVSLTNNGNQALDYSIFEISGTLSFLQIAPAPLGKVTQVAEAKKVDESGGGLWPEGSGGPDPFGYTYVDNNEPGGPMFDWIEISATGQDLGLSDDSDIFPVDLPFTFNFYGVDYTQIAVGSNGVAYFVDQYLGLGNACLPSDGGYGIWDFIAGQWDDLNPSSNGAVYYEAVNYKGQNVAVVEWYQVPLYGGSNNMTWEIVLFPNGSVLLQYLTMNGETGSGATVGLQGYWEDPTYYLEYSCNTAALADDLAICFAYPGSPGCRFGEDVPWVWEEPVTGTVPGLSTADVDVTVTSYLTDPLPLGTYTATLLVAGNDPVQGSDDVLVLMHIVSEYLTPTASFDSNSPVCLGATMVFTNTTIPGIPPKDLEGMPLATTYLWDFGDSQTSTDENPTHDYAAAGTYDVSLEACNSEGMCDTFTDQVQVLSLPVAGFTFEVQKFDVSFTNTSLDALTYEWDFGDGITSTEMNPTHIYADAGTYTVVLSATNDCDSDVYTAQVEVTGFRYIYLPIICKNL
jgi:hypothetical protein